MIQLSAASYSVNEDAGSITITVTRTGNTAISASIQYATTDAMASSPFDYNAASGTLTFAAGQSSKSFTVVINNDNAREANETFNVILSNISNANFGNPIAATITINDDDKRTRATPRAGLSQKVLRTTELDPH